MKPHTLGRITGIGLRMIVRILVSTAETSRETVVQFNQAIAESKAEVQVARSEVTGRVAKGTARGIGGLIRPFVRVGAILWLEVTGVFFLLFVAFFSQSVWRSRASYATGPDHAKFLTACGLCLLFLYLSVSSFWRARKK